MRFHVTPLIALTVLAASTAAAQVSPERAAVTEFRPTGRVALVTDYGTEDFYVGALKGAIVSHGPHVIVDDVTHEVPAYDISGGSFLLAAAAREWPAGTVFAAIVDPGVGTARDPIVLRTANGLVFVGPDNGLFTRVGQEFGIAEVRVITNEALLRPGALSSTFHGRDIFGPIAGYLASGGDLAAVGEERGDVVRVRVIEPTFESDEFRGQVVLADHYGNLLTNISESMLSEHGIERGSNVTLMLNQQTVSAPLSRTYGDVAAGENVAVINSQGQLEFAVNQGSLAEALGAHSGDEIRVQGALFH